VAENRRTAKISNDHLEQVQKAYATINAYWVEVYTHNIHNQFFTTEDIEKEQRYRTAINMLSG
jgi:hypothetical protein